MSPAASSSLAERILDCFPAGTYALNTLLQLVDIVESDAVPTAAVECRAAPRLLVNPEFAEAHADTPEKLLMLVMHELHHVLLGHTRLFPALTATDNFVFDAVINALLCRMFPGAEFTRFFTELYRVDRFPECLLRPPASWRPDCKRWPAPAAPELRKQQPLNQVHRALYSERGATYHEVYEVLHGSVVDGDVATVPLLGDHQGEGGSTGGAIEQRAPVLFDVVRRLAERWPQPPDPIAGRSLAELLRVRPIALLKDLPTFDTPEGGTMLLRDYRPGWSVRQLSGVSVGSIYFRFRCSAEAAAAWSYQQLSPRGGGPTADAHGSFDLRQPARLLDDWPEIGLNGIGIEIAFQALGAWWRQRCAATWSVQPENAEKIDVGQRLGGQALRMDGPPEPRRSS